MAFDPPVNDIKFALTEMAGIGRLQGSAAFPNYDTDLIEPVLEEAGKLARDVLAPLNQSGDKAGVKLENGVVTAAPGFAEAFAAFAAGGWMGLALPEDVGGQGLPSALALGVFEMVHSANMAFGLCPILNFGAVEALHAHGSDEQKATYLPNLISGKWTGTMNLTEPQAGSDVGALKAKAVPNEDGSYAITGQKVFITWGEHDMAENIIHLVLARLPDAPEGTGGISLFVCPKFLVSDDGRLGARNGVTCIGLEDKVGIHASPTCVMEYENAAGWLVGQPNRGLQAMFTMMNSARLQVGLQGVSVGEAAYQAALAYARERKQGKAAGIDGMAEIIHHPDIQRTLVEMKTRTMAARAICYACGVAADLAASGDEAAQLREDLLTPIAKAWSTDMAVTVASLGVQVHGGMGFMNETLAAQLYRDVRILPIYEGTNGIQAIDLVGRKLSLNNGAAMQAMIEDISATADAARATNHPVLVRLADRLAAANGALSAATDWMRDAMKTNRAAALASATAYQALAGDVIGGHFLTRGAVASGGDATEAGLAAFYGEAVLVAVLSGADALIGAADMVAPAAHAALGLA